MSCTSSGGICDGAQGKEPSAAMVALLKAAEQDNLDAQYELAAAYRLGSCVRPDYVEALKWFRKAADHGDARAQNDLGVMYAEGRGVPRNFAEAVKRYRKAADQGNATAQFKLGVMYDEGRGVAQDYVQAYMRTYLSVTAPKEEGEGPSEAPILLDEMTRKMTPQQTAEARRLAGEWKSKLAK